MEGQESAGDAEEPTERFAAAEEPVGRFEGPSKDAEETSGAIVETSALDTTQAGGAADAGSTQAAADAPAATAEAGDPQGEPLEASATAADVPPAEAEQLPATAEEPAAAGEEQPTAAEAPPGAAEALPTAAEAPPEDAEEPAAGVEEPAGSAEELPAGTGDAVPDELAEAAADPRNKYGHGWLTALPDPDAPPEPEPVEVVEEKAPSESSEEPPEPEPEEPEEVEEDYNELVLVADREAALAAVRQNGFALKVLPDVFRRDLEVVLAAVKENSLALKWALDEQRGDLKVVKAALASAQNSGSGGAAMATVSFALPELLGDKAAMLTLVAMDGEALQFASGDLKCDSEVVLAAVTNKHFALQYASPSLLNDHTFMMEVVDANPRNARALRYAGKKVRGHKEVAIATVKKYPFALEHCSMAMRDDDEVCLSAVRTNGLALQFASIRVRDDRRIAMEALLQNKDSWRFASRRLHADPEAMAAQGLEGTEAAILMDKNAKSAAAKITTSEDGFVEYRKPWNVRWPLVIVAPYGGEDRPDHDPVTRSRLPDRSVWRKELNPSLKTWELAEEVWEAFVVGSPGPPAMVRMKLSQQKVDADAPRNEACDGAEAALRAYDCYHDWLVEALKDCVQDFGFALLLDIRGQNHRRGVTEMSYLLTPQDLQLYDQVIDVAAPRPTSIDAFFRMPEPPKGRPGGLSELVRGKNSLAHQLERNGLKSVPCPRRPFPVDEMTLAKQSGGVVIEFEDQKKEVLGETVDTYLTGGYALRRYAAAQTVEPQEAPLPAADQDSWARTVAGIQVNASWDSRKDRMDRQRFGHVMMGSIELLLRVWLGFTPAADK